MPVCVLAEPAFEDFAVELWKEHVAATVARRGIEPTPEMVKRILDAAKASPSLLSEAEVLALVRQD